MLEINDKEARVLKAITCLDALPAHPEPVIAH